MKYKVMAWRAAGAQASYTSFEVVCAYASLTVSLTELLACGNQLLASAVENISPFLHLEGHISISTHPPLVSCLLPVESVQILVVISPIWIHDSSGGVIPSEFILDFGLLSGPLFVAHIDKILHKSAA